MQKGKPPLEGISVADFSWVLAGPRCTQWLSAMGARVIKVEGPRRPDQYRSTATWADGQPGIERSGTWHSLNMGKLDVTLDLGHPKGLDLAKRIISISDVFAENYAYGVIERLGLGYEEVCKVRPDIVYVSSSGLGRTGPERTAVAYGMTLHAYSGLDSVTGYVGDSVGDVGGTYTDPLTGTTMVMAVLSGLWHRHRTGEGQYIDMSMAEATIAQLPEFVMDYAANGRVARPQGNLDTIAAPNNCYPCEGEDSWVAITVSNQMQWEALCKVMGDPEWAADPWFADQVGRWKHQDKLDAFIAEWTRHRSAKQAMELLQAIGVPAGPSNRANDLVDDPHLGARGFFIDHDHPEVGTRLLWRLPWLMEPDPSGRYGHAPLLGEHNEYVLRDLLGVEPKEYHQLKEEGVII